MLRPSKKASELASTFVDDGDDLHMTSSFQASEENSSIAGNASCFDPPSIAPPMLKTHSQKEIHGGSTDDSGGSTTLEISRTEETEEELAEERTKFSNILPRVSLKKGLDRAQKLLPWRFSAFLVRPRQSKAIQEYQEMVDPETASCDAASDVASYAGTFHSIRSSRVNVGTGESLLVKQNAEVMGRPSTARKEWDIGSKLSSSGSSSGAGSSSRRLGRSLSWDNASSGARSDISQLTGDSFRSKRSDYTLSRAMYIHPAPNLLGTTEEEEERDENVPTEKENSAPNSVFFEGPIHCASTAKFVSRPSFLSSLSDSNTAQELNLFSVSSRKEVLERKALKVASSALPRSDEQEELSTWDLFVGNGNGHTISSPSFEKEQVRARVFSDSDFVFEMHRQKTVMEMCVDEYGFEVRAPSPSNRHTSNGRKHADSAASDCNRSRSYSDSFVPQTISTEQANDHEMSTNRSRCASENFVSYEHWDLNAESDNFEDFEFVKDSSVSEADPRLFRDTTRAVAFGTFSKPTVIPPRLNLVNRRKSQNGADCIPLLSDHDTTERQRSMSDPEVVVSNPFKVGRIPSPSQWRARGAVVSCEQPRVCTSSVSGEGGPTLKGIHHERQPEGCDDRLLSQPVQGLSSPIATSAAKVIASALRPPVHQAASTQNYYWNDGSDNDASFSDEDEEVLWSLDVDSFEDMF